MIPTRLKAKLSRDLSYPIGAEAVTKALDGAPHAGSLGLWFSDQAVWPASEFRRLLAERLPYVLMSALYQPKRKPGLSAMNDLVAKGFYEDKWDLRVHPVLRELRSIANRLHVEHGLPRLARWLRASREAGWLSTSRRIEFVFDPADSSLIVREVSGS